MMLERREVEFKTLDGLTLRGTLYPAKTDQPSPGVVMAPGFNCTKDMFIPEVASSFQGAGITTLAYDPRSIGSSAGAPRNDIDPVRCVSDYSDALTYLASCAEVDDSRLVIWGFSFSGAVALCAAALDPRAMCAIVVCPLVDLGCSKLAQVLRICAQDRISQTEEGNPPLYLPLLTEDGENPAGFGVGLAKEDFGLMLNAKRTIAPTFENKTTVQSYYRLAMWQPFGVWKLIRDTPVLWIVPENDTLSPAEQQIQCFESLHAPKESHMVLGKGHMDVLSGDDYPQTIKVQTDFIAKIAAERPYDED